MGATKVELKKLKEPFKISDLEWRVQKAGIRDEKPWAMILVYITNRAIQDRLDDVIGSENWQNQYIELSGGGFLCGISIRIGDEWLTKWDGSDQTEFEAVKGGISGAMKRAGVPWGIGRYLYNMPICWANFYDGKGALLTKHNSKYNVEIPKKSNNYYYWNPVVPKDMPAGMLTGKDKSGDKKISPVGNPPNKEKVEPEPKEKKTSKQEAEKSDTSGISKPQMDLIRIRINQSGVEDEVHEVVSFVLKRDIKSLKELDAKEAHNVIEIVKGDNFKARYIQEHIDREMDDEKVKEKFDDKIRGEIKGLESGEDDLPF